MADHEIEKDVSRTLFVATLRRVADSIEEGDCVRIQIAGKRFTVPVDSELSMEYEAEGAQAELELKLKWVVDC
jgi:amphi-Trp domain-containing protein